MECSEYDGRKNSYVEYMPIKQQKKRAYRKRRMYPKRKGFRPARSVPDIAKLSENYILNYPSPSGWAMNTMYQKRDFTIAANPRAAAVAAAYQHYRVKKVTLIFRPQVDTFVGGGALGGYTAPHLYYMIDKSGSLPTNVSIAALKSMGAKPIRLDEREIKISWRPSCLMNTVDAGTPGVFSSYKISPWLSTNGNALNPGVFNVSSVDHLGCFWYVETTGASTLNYTVEAVLDVEYKKPLNTSLSSDVEAIKC